MKVVVAHNRYRSATPSGENAVVDDEIRLLRDAGVDVVTMFEDSDQLQVSTRQRATAAVSPLISARGSRRLRALIATEHPDVVHLHNVFPQIGPGVVRTAKRSGLAVVQTVHNYRHACVNGLFFRDGHPCTRCLGHTVPVPALTGPCYRDSLPQTAIMTASLGLHRATWRKVDRFFVLTPFMKDILVRSGLPRDRVLLRPTWAPGPPEIRPAARDLLFVGRLDHYKGLGLLLEAWAESTLRSRGWALRIAGTGELSDTVKARAAQDASIVFHGQVTPSEAAGLYTRAAVVVVPSILFEGLPRVLVEAFAHGKPVAVGAGTSSATAVVPETGWVVRLDARDWTEWMDGLPEQPLARMGRAAREVWDRNMSPRAATESLLDTYGRLAAKPSHR